MALLGRIPAYLADAQDLRAFLEAGLHADPPTVGLVDERFSLAAQDYLHAAALDLASEGWTEEAVSATAGTDPVPAELGRNAAQEILAATAACVAHERCGALHIGGGEAAEAVGRVAAFSGRAGFGALVRVFCATASFENLQAVEFHNPMPESAFLSGGAHRPWVGYPLHDDLLMAAAAGTVRLAASGGARQIHITPHGRMVLGELRARLDASGVLARRRRQLAVSHRDWLALAGDGVAEAARREAWEEILTAAGIQPGSRVLLLGLAVGGEAFLQEIGSRVGPSGQVLVVDPAVPLLRRLAHLEAPSSGIRLLPGRLDALPLSDGAADACLAPAFLHVAEHEEALAELRRVVKSGGRVVLGVPHAVDEAHALLREWLQPLVELAARLEVPAPVAGHGALQAGEAMRRQGFLDCQVRPHGFPWTPGNVRGALLQALHGSELGRRVLERTPFGQRRDLVHSLLARGEQLLTQAEAAGHALIAPGELVLATVP